MKMQPPTGRFQTLGSILQSSMEAEDFSDKFSSSNFGQSSPRINAHNFRILQHGIFRVV
jgi:hypothetical protein